MIILEFGLEFAQRVINPPLTIEITHLIFFVYRKGQIASHSPCEFLQGDGLPNTNAEIRLLDVLAEYSVQLEIRRKRVRCFLNLNSAVGQCVAHRSCRCPCCSHTEGSL